MRITRVVLRVSTVLFLLAGLAACKLAEIVVEGGRVSSSSHPDCLAGMVCIIDVADTTFEEQFTAVPDEGWYFVRWNSGEGFWCAGSTNPVCSLSLVNLAGHPGVEEIVASSATFYLMPVFAEITGTPISDTITRGGKEWAQVDLFPGLSWNQIDAVCPGGPCVPGSELLGYDMTGWTWASVPEMNDFLQLPGDEPTSIYQFTGTWDGSCYYTDYWGLRFTTVDCGVQMHVAVPGWTSTRRDATSAWRAEESAVADINYGVLLTNATDLVGNVSSTDGGAWFYRDL